MLLTRRLSKDAALRFLDLICKAENVEVMQNDAAIEREAYDIFRKYAEHDFSITDCVSFVLMKSHALKRVFAFDKHFRTMRFSVEP
jgi:predicted nucleic acid-binding protein